MTQEDFDVLKGRLEEALVLADGHGLLLTGIRIAEAMDALASETRQDRKAA